RYTSAEREDRALCLRLQPLTRPGDASPAAASRPRQAGGAEKQSAGLPNPGESGVGLMAHRMATAWGFSSRRGAIAAPGALHFLAQRPNLCVTSKDGLAIGPRKRWSNVAGVSDDRAGRRLIAQVGPLQVESVAAVDA